MADTKIRILGENQASKALKEVDNSLGEVQKTVGSLYTTALKAAGVVAAVGTAVKIAFDLGEQGAVIQQMGESFDNLVEKVGASPDILNRMKDATRGTVDEMTLMKSALTLAAGADDDFARSLLEATPQLAEIAKASNKLNPMLGDTAFLFESINTGIKRGSPMILDNLGITIKMEEAYTKYATSLGKTATELSSTEQKQAILNATLEAGNILIEQVGGNVDATQDSFARLDAATKDITDELKERFVPILADVAEALAFLLTAGDEMSASLDSSSKEALRSSGSYEEYRTEMIKGAQAAGVLMDSQGNLQETGRGLGTSISETKWETLLLSEAEYEAAKAAEEQAIANETATARLQGLANQYMTNNPLVAENEELTQLDKDALIALEEIAKGLTFEELNKALDGNIGKFQAAKAAADAYYNSLKAVMELSGGSIPTSASGSPTSQAPPAGTTAVTVNYQPILSTGNQYELEQALAPIINNVVNR